MNYGMYELGARRQDQSTFRSRRRARYQRSAQKPESKVKTPSLPFPSFPTFATTISMPYLSEEEIAKAMPFEARKYIPVPLSEVQLD